MSPINERLHRIKYATLSRVKDFVAPKGKSSRSDAQTIQLNRPARRLSVRRVHSDMDLKRMVTEGLESAQQSSGPTVTVEQSAVDSNQLGTGSTAPAVSAAQANSPAAQLPHAPWSPDTVLRSAKSTANLLRLPQDEHFDVYAQQATEEAQAASQVGAQLVGNVWQTQVEGHQSKEIERSPYLNTEYGPFPIASACAKYGGHHIAPPRETQQEEAPVAPPVQEAPPRSRRPMFSGKYRRRNRNRPAHPDTDHVDNTDVDERRRGLDEPRSEEGLDAGENALPRESERPPPTIAFAVESTTAQHGNSRHTAGYVRPFSIASSRYSAHIGPEARIVFDYVDKRRESGLDLGSGSERALSQVGEAEAEAEPSSEVQDGIENAGSTPIEPDHGGASSGSATTPASRDAAQSSGRTLIQASQPRNGISIRQLLNCECTGEVENGATMPDLSDGSSFLNPRPAPQPPRDAR